MEEQQQRVLNQILRSMEKPTPEALYHQLGRLRNEMPPFYELGKPSASKWMGRALALVDAVDNSLMELVTLRSYFDHVNRNTPTAQTANMIAQIIDTVTDPYGDDKLISDFVPLAPEGLPVFVMCDEQCAKPSLKPAADGQATAHDVDAHWDKVA